MEGNTMQIAQAVLAMLSLVTVVGGLWAGIRYKSSTAFPFMPLLILAIGLIASIVGIIGIAISLPFILACGILAGGFLTGFGIGLSLELRTE
jgi:hypothetical protein